MLSPRRAVSKGSVAQVAADNKQREDLAARVSALSERENQLKDTEQRLSQVSVAKASPSGATSPGQLGGRHQLQSSPSAVSVAKFWLDFVWF